MIVLDEIDYQRNQQAIYTNPPELAMISTGEGGQPVRFLHFSKIHVDNMDKLKIIHKTNIS